MPPVAALGLWGCTSRAGVPRFWSEWLGLQGHGRGPFLSWPCLYCWLEFLGPAGCSAESQGSWERPKSSLTPHEPLAGVPRSLSFSKNSVTIFLTTLNIYFKRRISVSGWLIYSPILALTSAYFNRTCFQESWLVQKTSEIILWWKIHTVECRQPHLSNIFLEKVFYFFEKNDGASSVSWHEWDFEDIGPSALLWWIILMIL